MRRNILLLFVLIISSLLIAILFGGVISRYIFPFGGSWIVPQEIIYFVNSFPFVYLLLSPLVFLIWGKNKKWMWIIGSILPFIILDLYVKSGENIWFWSLVFFVTGVILAKLIRFIISKLKHPNPPMVIK